MPSAHDVVVVGAGSAGCALAHRLSADPACRVLLLEAGGADDRPAIRAPSAYFSLWGSDVDWAYDSAPQPGTAGRRHAMPRGKVLGGTSSLNGMVWLRGARSDYDRWAALGCAGWGWDDVRPAFEALEAWLRPAYLSPHNPLSAAMVAAGAEAGLGGNPDFDRGTLDGSGWNRSTIRDGERVNSHRAFVEPVRDRPNLTVRTGAHVVGLAFADGRVTGVRVRDAGGTVETIGAGETVLSAGVFESPRLLLRSGIGPAPLLERVGVRPMADLPVGEGLVDHLLIGVVYDATRPVPTLHAYCTEGCAFARSTPGQACDIEISYAKEPHFAPEADDGRPRYTIIPGITRPKSRGVVRLTGPGADDPLLIDPRYLSHPDDMATMLRAVRLTREIGAQPALADWNAGEHFPGPGVEGDAEIADYVRQGVSTWFHPVGTCRMGVGPGSVVGPDLRVHGVPGLRVADASVMPEIVSVNTNAAATMIGWRAGEIVAAGG